jgi:multiple sugar transport system permease protein
MDTASVSAEAMPVSTNLISAKKKRKVNLTPYLFIAPHVILFIAFFLVPTVFGIYVSFTKWNIYSDPSWLGLANYKTILFDTSSTFYTQFWNGLKNTVTFVILCVPFQIVIPLLIATALYYKPKGAKFFQSIFYMPTVFSITSVTLTWMFIFSRSLGLFNHLFGTNINWYGEQPFAWMTIVIVTLWWGIGGNMIIYIAALSGIDKSILESAQLDGATGAKGFFYIIIPSIKFQLVYTLVMSIIAQFNIYGQPLILTEGGPNQSTSVLLMYIRNLAFGTGTPIAGMASAMATCLGLIIGTVSIIQITALRNQDA